MKVALLQGPRCGRNGRSGQRGAHFMPSRFSMTVVACFSSRGVLDADLPAFFGLMLTGLLCFFMRRRERPILPSRPPRGRALPGYAPALTPLSALSLRPRRQAVL